MYSEIHKTKYRKYPVLTGDSDGRTTRDDILIMKYEATFGSNIFETSFSFEHVSFWQTDIFCDIVM